MSKRFLFCFLMGAFLCNEIKAQDSLNKVVPYHSKIRLQLLPIHTLAGIRTADPSSERMSIQQIIVKARQGDTSNFIGSMGGQFRIIQLEMDSQKVQIRAASAFYSYLQHKSHNLFVETGDFYVDFLIDYKPRSWLCISFGPGHTSQHFFDDAFELKGVRKSINYVRDYYQLFLYPELYVIHTTFHAGIFYNYHFLIDRSIGPKKLIQLGFESSPFKSWKSIVPYIAGDIKFREELDYKSSENLQAGIRIHSETSRVLRIALNVKRGISERGQFNDQKEEFTSIGAYFDF